MSKLTNPTIRNEEVNSDDIKTDLDTIAAAEATGNGTLASILAAFATLATAIVGATAKTLYDIWVAVSAGSINSIITTTAAGDVGPKTGSADMTGPTVSIPNLPLARYLYMRFDVVASGTLTVATTLKVYAKDPNGHCADTVIGGAVLNVATTGISSIDVPIDTPGAATQVYYVVAGAGETWSSSNYVTVKGSLEGIAN